MHDVASAVLRDAHGCWGFLDLWRGRPNFTPDERAFLVAVLPSMTRSLRAALAATFRGADTRSPARALGISEHTVNDHLKSIFAKSGVNSRPRLVTHARG